MAWIPVLIAIAIVIAVLYFAAREFEQIAEEKGFHGKTYFWWVFSLGIVGMLMVIALPDRNIKEWKKINEQTNPSQE